GEGADGRVVVSRPEAHRAPARGRPAHADQAALRQAQLRDAVRLLRRGDASAQALRRDQAADGGGEPGGGDGPGGTRVSRTGPAILVRLQTAVRERQRVLLGYVDQQGMSSQRIVRPTALDGGWLTAWDDLSGGPRRFVLHRVTAVADLPDPFAPDVPSPSPPD
ncbi:MAG: hypothetical protein IRZ08_09075, partial [Frankia sp.]|nr:hypothetical protein [Frankia sp.]